MSERVFKRFATQRQATKWAKEQAKINRVELIVLEVADQLREIPYVVDSDTFIRNNERRITGFDSNGQNIK